MNNDRTHAAVQSSVPEPAWDSADSDRLGYDGAGRMIGKRFLAGGIDGSTHAYDDTNPVVGFTTALGRASTKLYEWDASNRLMVVKRKSDDATIAEYVYNALNHRIRRTVSNGGLSGNVANGETNFVYNADWQCVEERDDADALLRQYVWGIYIDELLQQREDLGQSTEDFYPLQDLLYRSTALTDDTGSIIEAYDTDAYGNTRIFDAPGTGSDWWADDASQTEVPSCAFIFTGRRYDPETELYQYRHRYYAPVWGRFISRDPAGYPDGLDVYQYVRSMPIMSVDPTGEWLRLACCAVAACVMAKRFATTLNDRACSGLSGVELVRCFMGQMLSQAGIKGMANCLAKAMTHPEPADKLEAALKCLQTYLGETIEDTVLWSALVCCLGPSRALSLIEDAVEDGLDDIAPEDPPDVVPA